MFWIDSKARRRIEELQDELTKLQRDFKSLEMEWASAYDKLRSMMGRVAKRAEVVESATRDARSGDEAALSSGDPPATSPLFSTLTARQRQIQLSILRRRGNGGQT